MNDLASLEKDGDAIGNGEGSASGSSSASMSRDLEEAKKSIARHRAGWLLLVIAGVVYWNSTIFPDFSNWSSPVSILVLELFALFILAYALDMKEVVQLFWAAIRGYAKQDPGSPPERKADS